VTAKQRVVLGALRDAQHEHDGQAVSAYQIAAACPAPWQGRPDLVTQALVLLERDGLVLVAGSTRAWKITAVPLPSASIPSASRNLRMTCSGVCLVRFNVIVLARPS
jgi:hypothetical protein